MTDLSTLFAAALFLTFAVHRLTATGWRDADPGQRYLIAFACCMSVAMCLGAPGVVTGLDRLNPVDTPVMLATHELKTCAQGLLLFLALSLRTPAPAPRSVRRQLLLTTVVLAVAAVTLLAAGTRADDGLVAAAPDRRWLLAAYNALFAAYGTWCLLVLIRELGRHIGRLPGGPLRCGLGLMRLGAVVGTVWTLWVLTYIPGDLACGMQKPGEDAVCGALGAVTTVLGVSGATAALWGTWWRSLCRGPLGTPRRGLLALHQHRALGPLWSALHAELPHIALDSSAGLRRPSLWRAEFALYRRVIEIRDGCLALRPYVPLDVPGWAAEAADGSAQHRAILEAATIAAALENKQAGHRPAPAVPAGPAPQPRPLAGTIDAEAVWLIEVTAAFTASPAVADVRDRVRAAARAHRRASRTGFGGPARPSGPGRGDTAVADRPAGPGGV
jgi:predicted pyridoxine 5'-phosphate oxidase superfamily flavin-nucleotide-binding protein